MQPTKRGPDRNKNGRPKNTRGLILLIVLILIIPLFFGIPMRAIAPATPVAATPYTETTATPVVALPAEHNPVGHQPAECKFPLAQSVQKTAAASRNYVFSEPTEPLPADDAVGQILDWLPDNQNVLLTRQHQGDAQQQIELLNPDAGSVQLLGEREAGNGFNDGPAWVPGLNAVIYPESRVLSSARVNGLNVPPYEYRRQLWISYGDPSTVQLLEDMQLNGYVSSYSVAVRPDGKQIVYRSGSDKQLFRRNASLGKESAVSFDPSYWDYRGQRGRNTALPALGRMAWRPGTSQIFFYTRGGPDIGYTFLVDTVSGTVCELNLNGWAVFARWSVDGRYLAIVRAQEPSFPVDSTNLAVLDAMTGQIFEPSVTPLEAVGRHYVADLAWAPDGQRLLVLGSVKSYPACSPNCTEDTRLYLVDFLDDQVEPILPSDQFVANDPGTSLAWSPDGSKVLALCPNFCLITVQATGR